MSGTHEELRRKMYISSNLLVIITNTKQREGFVIITSLPDM